MIEDVQQRRLAHAESRLPPPMIVGVIGGETPPEPAMDAAERIGAELARRDCLVLTGGLGGVMEAASRGAHLAGGTVVGVLPRDDAGVANTWVDIPICTDIGWGRALVIVHSSDVIIAIDGSYGTLSEIAHALSVRVPVVRLDSWLFETEELKVHEIIEANSPEDAVHRAISAGVDRYLTRVRETPESTIPRIRQYLAAGPS